MKIKLISARVGDSFSQAVGEVVDLADDEAHRLINEHQAVMVPRGAPVEAATAGPAEHAVRPRPRRAERPTPTHDSP